MRGTVSDFFNRYADDYHEDAARHPNAPFHTQTARMLEEHLTGSVLCVGGLWSLASLSNLRCRITVIDVSAAMLKKYREEGVRLVVGDARDLPFDTGTFDHLVLPLLLHHITGPSVRSTRAGIRHVFREVGRVLRPRGQVWISELCVSRPVYVAELAAAPLTRALLGVANVPFVIMHSAAAYCRALEQTGFTGVTVTRVRSRDARPTDLVRPVDGIEWLRVPRFMFPVTATVLTGQKPGRPP